MATTFTITVIPEGEIEDEKIIVIDNEDLVIGEGDNKSITLILNGEIIGYWK